MATKCVLNKSTMTAIANAIRAKDGSTDAMLPGAMAAKITAIETSNPFYDGTRPLIDKLTPSANEAYLLADLLEFKSGMLGKRNSLQCNVQTSNQSKYIVEEGHINQSGLFVADKTTEVNYWADYVRSYTVDDPRYILFRIRPQSASYSILRITTPTTNIGNDDTSIVANSIVETNFNLPDISVNALPTLVMPSGYPYNSNNYPSMKVVKGSELNAKFNMQGAENLQSIEIGDLKGNVLSSAVFYNCVSLRKVTIHNGTLDNLLALWFGNTHNLVYLDLEGCDGTKCAQFAFSTSARLQMFRPPMQSKMWRASTAITGNWVNDADMRAAWLNALPDNTAVPQYSTSSTYAVGDWVWYNSKLYGCKTAVTSGESFNSSKWVEGGKWTLGTYLSSLSNAEKAIATNKGWTLA